MLMQQVREVMTVNQEMTDESSWIWLTSEQMGFSLRSEFANENHGEARSSQQCNDQRTDQTAFFLAPIITDFIRILVESLLWEERLGKTRIRTTEGLTTCMETHRGWTIASSSWIYLPKRWLDREQGLITVIQEETKRTEEKEEAGYRSHWRSSLIFLLVFQ